MKTNKNVKVKLILGICVSSTAIIVLTILLVYSLHPIYKSISEQNNSSSYEIVSNNKEIPTTEYNISVNNNNIVDINSDNAIIYDMGFITNIGDMLWLDDNRFIVISISEYNQSGYIWVFENDINKKTTNEKSIISLDKDEHYSSIKKLNNNKIAIATTKRIIFLNDELFETRSVMISKSDTTIKEVSINDDGTAILYINENGLYYRDLKSGTSNIIIGINKIGEGSLPYKSYFCNNNKIAFHYITSDLKLYCGTSDIDGNYTIFNKDCNYLTAITDKNIIFIDKNNRNKLIVIDVNSKNEIHYNFQNFTPLSLAVQNNSIYICGIDNTNSIYSVNIINNQNVVNTKLCINVDNMTFGGFIAVSPNGKIATQKYASNTENTKILILG